MLKVKKFGFNTIKESIRIFSGFLDIIKTLSEFWSEITKKITLVKLVETSRVLSQNGGFRFKFPYRAHERLYPLSFFKTNLKCLISISQRQTKCHVTNFVTGGSCLSTLRNMYWNSVHIALSFLAIFSRLEI